MTLVMDGHILLDDKGVAWIDDTNTKVIEVVKTHLGYGMTPEQMHDELPHLSIAQIHAALSHYHDHKTEFDARILKDSQEVAAMRAASPETPGRAKLRALGLRP